ncbi:MAG: hypothetical protein ACE37H_12135 [Phycisphaeraceae bacterium]
MNAFARSVSVLSVLMLALAVTSPALAQDRGGDGDRGGDRNDWRERWENASEEEREQMREEFRKRMEERRAEYEKQQAEQLRERLEMSEEDYEIIGPMIAKVRSAMRERDMATRGAGRDRGGRGGNPFGGEQSDEAKAASEAMAELRQAIEDDNSGDIKKALGKLRKARAALDKAVTDAREELRSVCTAKWEAQFVVMGVLD